MNFNRRLVQKKVALGKVVFVLWSMLILASPSFAQSADASVLIKGIKTAMVDHYIFLDKAKETNEHLDKLLNEGFFDSYKTPEELASALTEQMRAITKDMHVSVSPPRIQPVEKGPQQPFVERLARYYTPMINEVKYYEQNIGYLDMRFFGGGEEGIASLDEAMKQFQNADALIIDLRKNGGGSIRTVQYFCSYFFDQEFLLNKIYTRATDHTEELMVLDVKGIKRPKVPVLVLTSSRTFSGAEDFSYTLQSRKRATIIGEVTRGGAHPVRGHNLEGGFRVRVPYARSINPVTNSNWEGTGVIPDVETSEEEALEKALAMAMDSAAAYKKALFAPLETTLDNFGTEASTEKKQEVFNLLESLVKAGALTERDINVLGYHTLSGEKPMAALAVFESNTLLFPTSANAYDSYAEALAGNGFKELALENYTEAVSVAKEQEDYNLEAFERNLANFKKKLNE
ncbi:S41 family peptidase [Flammeovirgaceae bacterium SG7u.111]|nr:S41 family peptidase [Flammeovirgaceae bacterium SG7u.132]WPO33311.1 S41 family peptidase [Flammeovirgaceae bacterium SG7u.111]